MIMKKIILIFSVLIISLIACSGIKGQFAYKTLQMDSYRKMINNKEFISNEKIDWIYKIDSLAEKTVISTVVLKKEIVWVDVSKKIQTVLPASPYIYGEIKNLNTGDYKIILLKKNKIISEISFKIN